MKNLKIALLFVLLALGTTKSNAQNVSQIDSNTFQITLAPDAIKYLPDTTAFDPLELRRLDNGELGVTAKKKFLKGMYANYAAISIPSEIRTTGNRTLPSWIRTDALFIHKSKLLVLASKTNVRNFVFKCLPCDFAPYLYVVDIAIVKKKIFCKKQKRIAPASVSLRPPQIFVVSR
jgi:hypothetical protein